MLTWGDMAQTVAPAAICGDHRSRFELLQFRQLTKSIKTISVKHKCEKVRLFYCKHAQV